MRILRYVPKHYAGSDMESIASVLNFGYVLLSAFLGISFVRQLIEGDFTIAIIIAVSFLFSIFVRFQFLKGYLKQSVIIVVVFFNILLTLVCTLGNGINDIGIIGYPIIIGFSGIILDQRNLLIASALSISGVIWLVAGEYFLQIEVNPALTATAGDFVVSALYVVLGGFVAFNLTNNMRLSIVDAQREISVSKTDAVNLEKQTEEKLEIIEEIHRAVINSLGHIQNLIDHKQGSSEVLKSKYESLKSKVTVIEVAHEILLAEKSPIKIDIKEFTLKLLNKYEEFLKTPVLKVSTENRTNYIALDLAINYGICLIELIKRADNEINESMNISFNINDGLVTLKIYGFESKKSLSSGIVIDLLTQQLRGKIEWSSNELQLSFDT